MVLELFLDLLLILRDSRERQTKPDSLNTSKYLENLARNSDQRGGSLAEVYVFLLSYFRYGCWESLRWSGAPAAGAYVVFAVYRDVLIKNFQRL